MRVFALELDNTIKGLPERKQYIESLLAKVPTPDLVLLPELAICRYLPNQNIWRYADQASKETATWAMEMAGKYNTYLGIGYVDYENGEYYNRYMLVDRKEVYGIVTKNEGEAAVFKRGRTSSPIIKTPFGNVAIAICYDAWRKHFYEEVENQALALIVFPHGRSFNPKKKLEEKKANDYLANQYVRCFDVPVIYVNSFGPLELMPGIMGRLMKWLNFTMNGHTKIYTNQGRKISLNKKEIIGCELNLFEQKRRHELFFYGKNLMKGNFLFRHTILKLDILLGVRKYQKNKNKK